MLPSKLCSKQPPVLHSLSCAMVAKSGYMKKELAQMTNVSQAQLETLSVERIQLIFTSLKPQKIRALPSNWKRFSKSELANLYLEKMEPTSNQYLSFTKTRLISELEMYAEEMEEQFTQEGLLQEAMKAPMCVKCRIPMIERFNKASRMPFWGCATFPICRETMSKEYDHVPAALAQKAANPMLRDVARGSASGGPASKVKRADDSEEMEGVHLARAVRMPVPEDPEDAVVTLTEEEIQMIQKSRPEKKK